MKQPDLCCPKCGSLNITVGMPDVQNKKMAVYCNDCWQDSIVDIKITGMTEDGKLKIEYIPSLIISQATNDRTQKYLVL